MDFGPYKDFVAKYVHQPYKEIENKIYIDQYQGLWALHEKYDLLKNSEAEKLLSSMIKVIRNQNTETYSEFEQEKIDSMVLMMNREKYAKIILNSLKTQNFPSEFRGKKVFFLDGGKIYEV